MSAERNDSQPEVEIAIRDNMIRLGQFLKLAGAVDNGSQARELLERGEVTVNGVPETRRGRQLHVEDQVIVRGQCFVVATD